MQRAVSTPFTETLSLAFMYRNALYTIMRDIYEVQFHAREYGTWAKATCPKAIGGCLVALRGCLRDQQRTFSQRRDVVRI